MSRIPAVQVDAEWIPFTGGLDTTTPAMQKKPGTLINALNFEQNLTGGYDTVTGYERADGRPSPSDAEYALLTCQLTDTVSVGDVVTDAAGTSYGTVIAVID